MALALKPAARVTISVKDLDNNKGSVEYFFDSSLAADLVVADVELVLIPALNAIWDCVVTAWHLTYIYEDNVPGTPAAASDVERKGVFSFKAANGARMTTQVPSILASKVVDNSNKIAIADTAVAAYIDLIVNGTLFSTISPMTYLASDITSFVDAEKHHRASSKG